MKRTNRQIDEYDHADILDVLIEKSRDAAGLDELPEGSVKANLWIDPGDPGGVGDKGPTVRAKVEIEMPEAEPEEED